MRANEFRIGNYLHDSKRNICIVEELKASLPCFNGERKIVASSKNNAITHLPYVNIELTEEWLLSFGFKKLKSYEYELNDVNLINVGCEFEFTGWRKKPIRINFVHELQNLYFILTDEELTV